MQADTVRASGSGYRPSPATKAQKSDSACPVTSATTSAPSSTQTRGALGDARSLAAYRDWLDDRAQGRIDPDDIAGALGDALTAAHLAGRYDVEETAVELAEQASLRQAQLPFEEQVEFFRGKLSLPSRTWTTLWQEQHDVAFVVAGATRDSLVSDLRNAVDSAIADGTTLESFR